MLKQKSVFPVEALNMYEVRGVVTAFPGVGVVTRAPTYIKDVYTYIHTCIRM